MLDEDLELSLREWIESYQQVIVTSSITYRGVPTWKQVLDLWIYQEIIHETQPEVVVEIGCKFGGSALWLRDTMQTAGHGEVVAIDLLPRPSVLPPEIHFVQGNSVSPEVVKRVWEICAGKRVMVIADGNHAAAHVIQELRLYGPLIPVGGYFVVEDGIVDAMGWTNFTPGPRVAVERFLAEDGGFEIDSGREKFGITYNPDGFLRRAREPGTVPLGGAKWEISATRPVGTGPS